MSGLLERIARRRRAPARSRLSAYAALSLPPEATSGEILSSGNGHHAPESEHDAPGNGHHAPESEHDAPGNGHHAPENGHHANGNGHHANGNGHHAPENGHHANGNGNRTGNGATNELFPAPWLAIAAAQTIEDPPAAADPQSPDEPRETQPQTKPGHDAPAEEDARRAGLLARGRIRRRVLYLRALRELQLRDLGGFLLELHRYGEERPHLVAAKLDSAALVDSELRGFEQSLDAEHAPGEIRVPGIGGACEQCGAVHGSADRFCANCGVPLAGQEQIEADPPLLASSAAGATVGAGPGVAEPPGADTLADEA